MPARKAKKGRKHGKAKKAPTMPPNEDYRDTARRAVHTATYVHDHY